MVGWFGKRGQASSQALPPQKITKSNWGASAAPAMTPADSDGVSRVFSKELFEGEVGAFLRSAGFSPDMPGNILPTAETFATLEARYRNELDAFVESANRVIQKNGVSVKPILLIPETVWQGEYRNFLCATCRFYPADATNVFFAAATPQTAQALLLPLRAKMASKEAHDFAVQLIGVLADICQKAIAAGNTEREAASVAYEQARGLGMVMAGKLFDPPQVELEQKLFGPRIYRDYDKLASNF